MTDTEMTSKLKQEGYSEREKREMAKKRGNPAFRKGKPNPYFLGKGKKGKEQGDKAKEIPNSLPDTPQNQDETFEDKLAREE